MLPLLIDFDGIIKIGNKPAEDARSFLQFISQNKIPAFILSNSTLHTGQTVKNFLFDNDMDFDIGCMTTVDASLEYLRQNNLKVSVYCNEEIEPLFSNYNNNTNHDAVLIGDLGDKWSYDILNEIFRKVHEGAEIIAMQKNKFWKPAGELCLDAGAFIAAIEYAAGKESVLIGKPSPLYFQASLEKLGYGSGSEFIMIGDDIENDIEAAQKINGKGILVYTGKTRFPLPSDTSIKPDYEAKNLAEVISFLQENPGFLQPRVHQDQTKHPGN
ncbi:MAG: HAD-IA family hydrolase [Ignavibacteriaceae bacterium]